MKMAKKVLSDSGAEARRAYQREHYAKNKELYREKMIRYWEKKAIRDEQAQGGTE
jgi:hypothetical protein